MPEQGTFPYGKPKVVAGLLPETSWQSTEISGKRGAEIVEYNKIKLLGEKTLNQ
jgi:hypothetical protein